MLKKISNRYRGPVIVLFRHYRCIAAGRKYRRRFALQRCLPPSGW